MSTGFVFMDDNKKPFYCTEWGGEYWLFYWHNDEKWVSLREVTENEMASFPRNMTEEEQQLYHDKHNRRG